MAYSKVSNKTQDKDVKYLSKDFNSYKSRLIEFTQTYFPDNFNDFSEGNPGMMFLEMAAYVGDVLSFYTDTQLRESFLNLAQEKESLKVVDDQLGSPTSAKDLSKAIMHMIGSNMFIEASSKKEIFHFCNSGVCSWYELAKEIVKIKNLDCKIIPCNRSMLPPRKIARYKSICLYGRIWHIQHI